jgi:Mycothiol maleylpyruvate isomerase N-terminal domain
MAVDHREALTALDRAYAGIEEAVAELTPTGLLTRTRCHGWLVVDLLFHLLGDAQRRLVALVSPAPGPADRDHVSYRTGFAAEANTGAGAWWIRRSASAFRDGAGVVA